MALTSSDGSPFTLTAVDVDAGSPFTRADADAGSPFTRTLMPAVEEVAASPFITLESYAGGSPFTLTALVASPQDDAGSPANLTDPCFRLDRIRFAGRRRGREGAGVLSSSMPIFLSFVGFHRKKQGIDSLLTGSWLCTTAQEDF